MKNIINMGLSLAFLGFAGWLVKDVILEASPNPIGGTGGADVEEHRGEIETFRQSK